MLINKALDSESSANAPHRHATSNNRNKSTAVNKTESAIMTETPRARHSLAVGNGTIETGLPNKMRKNDAIFPKLKLGLAGSASRTTIATVAVAAVNPIIHIFLVIDANRIASVDTGHATSPAPQEKVALNDAVAVSNTSRVRMGFFVAQ